MTMNIEQLFEKPLLRNINGVIKAEQVDQDSIFVELDEYVVTNELERHFRGFFETYADAVRQPLGTYSNKMGVWISGFFGSGKSHFLKILSYILANQVVESDPAKRRPIDFFQNKVKDSSTFADMQTATGRPTDVILFNIDARANTDDREDSILKVFLKVFNERIGYCSELAHVANFERMLDQKGVYQKFKTKFKELQGNDWEVERDAYDFYFDEVAQAVQHATGQSKESAEKLLSSLEQNFPLNIKSFCEWVKEYLDSHPQNHNLLFLVDEIGQFISSNTQMMLKLQTLTEELGVICGGRAWVVVTSQADMNAAIGGMEAKDSQDFSKIQGRFSTKLALSSSNTLEVIQKRLLGKTDAAKSALTQVYADKGDILRSQLIFDANTTANLEKYNDTASFIANYPFIPYQCQILQKVFEAIRTKGATGQSLAMGERSLLDAYQTAAKQYKDHGLDVLIPFYSFYDSIESFLEPGVKRTIEQAAENSLLDQYDARILQTLFMTRYVELIKCTLENLVVLCIDQIDIDTIALKSRIEKSLTKLESQLLITRNGDEYVFLTNEEKEVENEIRNTAYQPNEATQHLSSVIYNDILKSKTKYRYSGNGQDFVLTRYCNGISRDGSQLTDLVVNVISPLDISYSKFGSDYDLEQESLKSTLFQQGSIVVRIKDDNPRVWDEIKTYIQTDRYLNKLQRNTSQHQARLMQDKQQENSIRERRIIEQISKLLNEASLFALGTLRPVQTNIFATNLDQAFEYVIENSFKHINELTNHQQPLDEIKKLLIGGMKQDQMGLGFADNSNQFALTKVQEFADLQSRTNRTPNVMEVLDNFSKRPYGWNEHQVLLLIVQLVVDRRLELNKHSGSVELNRIYEDLISPRKQNEFLLTPIRQHAQDALKKVITLAKDAFDRNLNGMTEAKVVEEIRSALQKWLSDLNTYQAEARLLKRCPSLDEVKQLLAKTQTQLAIQNDYSFVEALLKNHTDWLNDGEDFTDIRDFFDTQISQWKQLENALFTDFNVNKARLTQATPEAAAWFASLEQIHQHAKPFSRIKDIAGLIEKLAQAEQQLLQQIIEKTKTLCEKRINELKQAIAKNEFPSEITNPAFMPLRALEGRIIHTKVIDSLIALQGQFREAFEQGLEVLNDYIDAERQHAEKAQRAAEHVRQQAEIAAKAQSANGSAHQSPPVTKPIEPVPVAKTFVKTQTIQPKAILRQMKADATLANVQDVNDFIAKLHRELLNVIEQGDIARLD